MLNYSGWKIYMFVSVVLCQKEYTVEKGSGIQTEHDKKTHFILGPKEFTEEATLGLILQ